MNLGTELNINDMPEESSFAPIPAGWYQVSVKAVELKTSNAGNSTYLNIQYSILAPTNQGRVVFGMCGVTNQDPDKEATSRYFLGQLMRACALSKLTDTDQLIGANLEIQLTVKPAVMETVNGVEIEKYPAGNNVKSYRAMAGSSLPTTNPSSGASTAPWMKK